MKKLAVVIGRFQPFHNAHKKLIEFAKAQADEICIILGSKDTPLSLKNPFSVLQRVDMIDATFGCTNIAAIADIESDREWVKAIELFVITQGFDDDQIVLVGHKKDQSSAYLDFFPFWDKRLYKSDDPISATMIRDLWFNNHIGYNDIAPFVPQGTLKILKNLWHSKERLELMSQYQNLELERLKK